MPAEMKAKWVEALRSGKYKQGKGNLEVDTVVPSYCCLGVLQKVVTGTCEPYPAPSAEWYGMNHIELSDDPSHPNDNQERTLMCMNDGTNNDEGSNQEEREYTFKEIADWIEENIEVTDRD